MAIWFSDAAAWPLILLAPYAMMDFAAISGENEKEDGRIKRAGEIWNPRGLVVAQSLAYRSTPPLLLYSS